MPNRNKGGAKPALVQVFVSPGKAGQRFFAPEPLELLEEPEDGRLLPTDERELPPDDGRLLTEGLDLLPAEERELPTEPDRGAE